MTLNELVEKVGGEFVRGMARVRQGQTYTVIGKYIDGQMQMTPEGVEMAKALEAPAKKRGRPRKEEVAEPEEDQVELGLATEE